MRAGDAAVRRTPRPQSSEVAAGPLGSDGRPFLYVLNLVRTKHISGVKRGARTKAMAICTQHQFLHVYKVPPPPAVAGRGRALTPHRAA